MRWYWILVAARQAVGRRSKSITSILTPGYAPIEQYDSRADDVGPWSDIYALGMVAYRCISGLGDGELPDAVTRGRARRKGQAGLTPAVEAGKGRYHSGLLEAIDWALEVDEDARPQSVDAWRETLAGDRRRQRPAESERGTVSNPPSGTATERTGMNWPGVALTTVILALVVGVWMASQLYSERSDPGSVEQTPLPLPGDTPQRTSAKPAIESAGSATGQAGAEIERQRLEMELAGEMVSIPGGTFQMGDLSGDGSDWEKPVHSVTVPAFEMGKYEVTFAQWDACMADGGCGGYTPDDVGWGRGNRPVINVSWDDVQLFIAWLK